MPTDPSLEAIPVDKARLVGSTLCTSGDVALPRLYLLGQQKSGTTTIATALFQSGVVPMVQGQPAGNIPLYLRSMRANHSQKLLAGNVKESNLLAGIAPRSCWEPSCLARAQKRWVHKLSPTFSDCASWQSTVLADMSTDTFPHADRATLLRSFYGEKASRRLMLVVIMRAPLQRFQSGFYWTYNPAHFGLPRGRNHAHNRTLGMELAMLRKALPPDFKTATTHWARFAQDRRFDCWARSMYSLNWRPWLEQFHPDQFVALPMKWALQDVGRATQLIANHFGIALRRQPHIMGTRRHEDRADTLNPNRHPSMEEDAAETTNQDTLRWLASTFFDPDTVELARMFSSAAIRGLVLGGANGTGLDQDNALRALHSGW